MCLDAKPQIRFRKTSTQTYANLKTYPRTADFIQQGAKQLTIPPRTGEMHAKWIKLAFLAPEKCSKAPE